jgi:prepilin-type N-terminal cleavage/methylation domain-containing protein
MNRVVLGVRDKQGFTLLEILAALAIAGSVAVLAHRVFTSLADGAARLEQTRAVLDREMNARRMLQGLAGSLEIDPSGSSGFVGEATRVSFTSWPIGGNGWPSRRRVTIALRDSALIVDGLDSVAVVLREGIRRATFDYLLQTGAGAPWLRQWSSPVSAPIAIRLRVEEEDAVDTVLLVVGPRG